MFRKEDFDARAGGLRGFDEDEFVFVGQDHRKSLDRRYPNACIGNLPTRTVFGKLRKHSRANDFFSETLLVHSHPEDGR